jgi:hypothetical protein
MLVAPSFPAVGATCAICQTTIEEGESHGACPSCDRSFHVECWQENGGCAIYGCPCVPEKMTDAAPLQPVTVWGQEDRECPSCGRTIKAAALRCRHCGRVLASSAVDTQRLGSDAPEVARPSADADVSATVVFVAGIVPCTAPFALLFALGWLAFGRRALRTLPWSRRVMFAVGSVAAAATTCVLLLVVLLYDGVG